MKFLLYLFTFLFLNVCTGQDLFLHPIKRKSAPPNAIVYMKESGIKFKKAKWYGTQSGIVVADFKKKKKQPQISYFFSSGGSFMYTKRPVTLKEVPEGLASELSERVTNTPGIVMFVFTGKETYRIYSVEIPHAPGRPIIKYFTEYGSAYQMNYK